MAPHPLDPIIEALEAAVDAWECPTCDKYREVHEPACEIAAALALARKWRERGDVAYLGAEIAEAGAPDDEWYQRVMDRWLQCPGDPPFLLIPLSDPEEPHHG